MRVEIIAKHVQALDFVAFREVARRCIELRGYHMPTISDGWSDGGRDLRVYSTTGATPLKVAVQISVEADWKSKLTSDAKKAVNKLKSRSFIYVTNRRIGDAEFQPLSDKIFGELGLPISKMDQQDISQMLIDQDMLAWFIEFLDLPIQSPAKPVSLRREVADAFILFSDESTQFKRRMVEHALIISAAQEASVERQKLVKTACDVLGMSGRAAADTCNRAVDRLLQNGRFVLQQRHITVAAATRKEYQTLRPLVEAEWADFVHAVETLLTPLLPKKAKHDVVARDVAAMIGRIVLSYREYQAAVLTSGKVDDKTRNKYLKEARRASATLVELGVPDSQSETCMRQLSSLADSHPVVSRLTAGEVFRRLTSVNTSDLLSAFGRSKSLEMWLDSSIMIPLLCARLYGDVPDKFVRSTRLAYDGTVGIGQSVNLPDVYLEECAAHLIDAGRYAPIVASAPKEELEYSENAFVSFYSLLPDGRPEYFDFLQSFGYRRDISDFGRHRDTIAVALTSLAKAYGINVKDIRRERQDLRLRKRSEEDLLYIYKDLKEQRPDILMRHDARVLEHIRRMANTTDIAQILVTWDKTLQMACISDQFSWWCLDPVNTCDLLALISPDTTSSSLGVEVALLLPETDRLAAATVWDAIVSIERDELKDAGLLSKARKFRDEFLRQQQSDSLRTGQIVAAWKRWKENIKDEDLRD